MPLLHGYVYAVALLLVTPALGRSDAGHINPHGVALKYAVGGQDRQHANWFGEEQVDKCSSGTHYQFTRYLPSVWEQEWYEHRQEYGDIICETMQQQEQSVREWINSAALVTSGAGGGDPFATFNKQVFSRFIYKNICTNDDAPESEKYLTVMAEPITGLLRHPYFSCFQEGVHVEDKGYLPLPGMSLKHFRRLYPGKAYLFDCGSNSFGGSLAWLIDTYEQHGIEFDQLYAWESQTINQTMYWPTVYRRVSDRLHLMNVPLSTQWMETGQPLQILQKIYRPGDFVVFKLDIDVAPLEMAMLQHIKESNAKYMISDLFTEVHIRVKEMQECCKWTDPDFLTYEDAQQVYHEMRSLGVRMHFWP